MYNKQFSVATVKRCLDLRDYVLFPAHCNSVCGHGTHTVLREFPSRDLTSDSSIATRSLSH